MTNSASAAGMFVGRQIRRSMLRKVSSRVPKVSDLPALRISARIRPES